MAHTPPRCTLFRHIKVSDFGLARTKANSSTQTQVGTWAWMAPEVLEQKPYDEKADVYSYGVILWGEGGGVEWKGREGRPI